VNVEDAYRLFLNINWENTMVILNEMLFCVEWGKEAIKVPELEHVVEYNVILNEKKKKILQW